MVQPLPEKLHLHSIKKNQLQPNAVNNSRICKYNKKKGLFFSCNYRQSLPYLQQHGSNKYQHRPSAIIHFLPFPPRKLPFYGYRHFHLLFPLYKHRVYPILIQINIFIFIPINRIASITNINRIPHINRIPYQLRKENTIIPHRFNRHIFRPATTQKKKQKQKPFHNIRFLLSFRAKRKISVTHRRKILHYSLFILHSSSSQPLDISSITGSTPFSK